MITEVTRSLCFVITIPSILNDIYIFHQKLIYMLHQNVNMKRPGAMKNAYILVTRIDFSQTVASIERLHHAKSDR